MKFDRAVVTRFIHLQDMNVICKQFGSDESGEDDFVFIEG